MTCESAPEGVLRAWNTTSLLGTTSVLMIPGAMRSHSVQRHASSYTGADFPISRSTKDSSSATFPSSGAAVRAVHTSGQSVVSLPEVGRFRRSSFHGVAGHGLVAETATASLVAAPISSWTRSRQVVQYRDSTVISERMPVCWSNGSLRISYAGSKRRKVGSPQEALDQEGKYARSVGAGFVPSERNAAKRCSPCDGSPRAVARKRERRSAIDSSQTAR